MNNVDRFTLAHMLSVFSSASIFGCERVEGKIIEYGIKDYEYRKTILPDDLPILVDQLRDMLKMTEYAIGRAREFLEKLEKEEGQDVAPSEGQ